MPHHNTENLKNSELRALGNKLFAEVNEAWIDVAAELDCGNQMVNIKTEPLKRQLGLIFDSVVKIKVCLEGILLDLLDQKKGLQVDSIKTLKTCFSRLAKTVIPEEVDIPKPISRELYVVLQDKEKFVEAIQGHTQ